MVRVVTPVRSASPSMVEVREPSSSLSSVHCRMTSALRAMHQIAGSRAGSSLARAFP
jgi:hypothetical protein